MTTTSKQFWSLAMSFAMFAVTTKQAAAQEHVVPLAELQGKLRSVSEQRGRNIADIQRVLAYPAAAEALQKASVNRDQVKVAVATLNDAELARLADQARASEKDVQGGLIIGILALIGAIVVIIIVVAVVKS
jgi:phosphopentomutase